MLSSHFCLSRLLITSSRCSLSLSSAKHHACSSSSLSGASSMCSLSSSSMEHTFVLLPFRHHAAMCPVLPRVQNPFSCRLLPFLPLPFCHGFFSTIFATLVPFLVPSLTLSKIPLPSAGSFDNSLQCKVYNSLIAFFSRTCTIIFRRHSKFHRSPRTRGRKPFQVVAERELKNVSESPQGAEILDRRNEVINGALAEEVQRGEQSKKGSDDTAATILEPEPAASPARDSRESPIEPDQDRKRRLLMKSASPTASGS